MLRPIFLLIMVLPTIAFLKMLNTFWYHFDNSRKQMHFYTTVFYN